MASSLVIFLKHDSPVSSARSALVCQIAFKRLYIEVAQSISGKLEQNYEWRINALGQEQQFLFCEIDIAQ